MACDIRSVWSRLVLERIEDGQTVIIHEHLCVSVVAYRIGACRILHPYTAAIERRFQNGFHVYFSRLSVPAGNGKPFAANYGSDFVCCLRRKCDQRSGCIRRKFESFVLKMVMENQLPATMSVAGTQEDDH
jgi:hypothetical protein